MVLAAASETAMVLRPLRREDMLTAVAAGPTLPLTAAAAPPVPVTSAVVAVGAAPRPLRLGDVVVVGTAFTPLLGCLRAASKLAFLFPVLVGMVMRINAELLMLAQKR